MKPTKQGLFADVSRDARKLGGELRSGDGVDPREEAKRRRRERRAERPGQGHGVHKQEQFLAQVREAIETALQAAATPILNLLMVHEVVQQGGSLVVVLTPTQTGEAVDLEEATKAIEEASPRLRGEVAAAITRKDTPHLTFILLPPGARKLEE
jgi:ribosome-binding factor A